MKRFFVLLAAAALWVGCDRAGDQGGTGSDSGSIQRDSGYSTTPSTGTGTNTNQTNQIQSPSQNQQGTQQEQQQPQQPQPEQ